MVFSSEKMKQIKPSSIRELFAKAAGVEGVISLGIGAPDIHAPVKLREAMIEAVEKEFDNYDQTPGNVGLRNAIVEKYKTEYGMEYDQNNGTIITSGGCQLIYTALQTYVNHGDEVLIQDPCFLTYAQQIGLSGGKPVWMESTEDYKIDTEKIKEKITDKTRIIILNFPSNPTGATMSKKELQGIVDLAVDHDMLILSDEVYEYYLFDDEKHVHVASLNGAYERTITMNSFSKSYCVPGWRIGFGVGDTSLIKPVVGYHSFVIANATTPQQVALSNFILTKEAKEFVEYVKNMFQERRDKIVKGFNSLEGIHCPVPKGAFYCFPKITESKYPDGIEFSNKIFDEAKVVLVPGIDFGPTSGSAIRASFGSVSVEKIDEVIERLQGVL